MTLTSRKQMLRFLLVCLCALLVIVGAASTIDLSEEEGVDESFAEIEAESEMDSEMDAYPEIIPGSSFYTAFTPKGYPSKGGGEEWEIETNTIVTNMWGGLAIGNIAKDSHVMIERYIYHKDQQEEATYGWGFVLTGTEGFGGWYGATSCSWIPLQRNFLGRVSSRAVKVKAHPQHKPRCLPYSNNTGDLNLKAIQHKRGLVDGHDGLGVVKRMRAGKPCDLYTNFDKSSQTFTGTPIMTIPQGSLLGRRYIVEGITAKAALVQTLPGVDNKGWQGWFFTPNECLEDL